MKNRLINQNFYDPLQYLCRPPAEDLCSNELYSLPCIVIMVGERSAFTVLAARRNCWGTMLLAELVFYICWVDCILDQI